MKINAAYIEEYARTREHRLVLESQARELGKVEKIMEAEMRAYVTEQCGKKEIQRCHISGWQIELEKHPGKVKWAEEFVKHCGATVAARVKQAVKPIRKFVLKPLTLRRQKFVRDVREEVRSQITQPDEARAAA